MSSNKPYIRFEKTARRLYCQPWVITARMHRVISEIFMRHLASPGSIDAMSIALPGAEEVESKVVNGVAVVPVRGVISKGISSMDRISGATDVDEIRAMIADAVADDGVRGIVLAVDSPGGEFTGTPELSDFIRIAGKTKRIVAATDTMMASGAYWIASAASAIFAAESAEVGSIGAYLAVLDESGAYAQAGVRMDVIASADSPMKGAGMPGTSLTAEQRADLQAGVDYIRDMFVRAATRGRKIEPAAMRGQTLFGRQALAAGLVDYIGGVDAAIAALTKSSV